MMCNREYRCVGGNRRFVGKTIALLGLLLTMGQAGVLSAAPQPEQRISRPGQYQGYSQARFDGWRRTSQYLPMRDGTRIALDVFRPTKNNVVHEARLPVIWEHRRYQRAMIDQNGRIYSQLDRQDHPMRKVVPCGYIFAVADVRGAGASFGTRIDPNPPQESLDAYDITEWLAAQPWWLWCCGLTSTATAPSTRVCVRRCPPGRSTSGQWKPPSCAAPLKSLPGATAGSSSRGW